MTDAPRINTRYTRTVQALTALWQRLEEDELEPGQIKDLCARLGDGLSERAGHRIVVTISDQKPGEGSGVRRLLEITRPATKGELRHRRRVRNHERVQRAAKARRHFKRP